MFKECYALEKIHGSSGHILWQSSKLSFFAGGCNHENFVKLFDQAALEAKFKDSGAEQVVIYGEGYGGKMQGMSETYGKELKFIAFEVKINGYWLAVPQAEAFAKSFGLEFVHYVKIPATIEEIEAQKNLPSVQAKRNGIVEDKPREGVVLRPLIEVVKNNGERIIAKHKIDKFRETKTPRTLDPEQLKVLSDAQAISEEWVTVERLGHVLDHIGGEASMERMQDIMKEMIADIEREGKGEIVASKEARKAIGKKTVELVKSRLNQKLGL